MLRRLLRVFFALRRRARPAPPLPAPPADPRARDPWLAAILAALGERYQLGDDGALGTQVLRRTGRARFHPMSVYLRAAAREVAGRYEVRAHGESALADARALLDREVTAALASLGLAAAEESVEEWGGQVLSRVYRGACDAPATAAAAVRFMCQESEQIMDTAAQ